MFWLCLVIAAPTGSEFKLYCLIPLQCWSDFASSSPLPQTVCYIVWSLDNVDLTLPCHCRSHRKYVILFDPLTMSIWLCLVIDAPTEGMLYCLIPGQWPSDSASSSPLPQMVYYLVWSLDNVDLTLPRYHRSHRTYVIILLNPWTISVWLCLVLPLP